MIDKIRDKFRYIVHSAWSVVWKLMLLGLLFIASWAVVGSIHRVADGASQTTLLIGDRVWVNRLSYILGQEPVRGDCIIIRDPEFVYDENRIRAWWQYYVGINLAWLGLVPGPDLKALRVIGVAGDRIEGRIENGEAIVVVDDKVLDESYTNTLPLIALRRFTGFVDFDHIWSIPIPDFLQLRKEVSFYAYDPGYDLASQPYYVMSSRELFYKPGTFERYFKFPGEPAIDASDRVVDNFGPINIEKDHYWAMGDSRQSSIDSRHFGVINKDQIVGFASYVMYSIDSQESWWALAWLKSPVQFWRSYVRWWRTFKNIS
jgi:signal peptidase I